MSTSYNNLLVVREGWILLFCLLLLQKCPEVQGVPPGFVAEGMTRAMAITGAFAPNPRNEGKPMLLLSSKEGIIYILEDPDNDPTTMTQDIQLVDLMCTNGERGLQSIRPHPDFNTNGNYYIYVFYPEKEKNTCANTLESDVANKLIRYEMNPTTLQLDLSTKFIMLTTPNLAKPVHNGGTINFGTDGT
jgi:glucose/arabinose dehydrogenase